jgi:hypothetical protein
MLTPLSISDLVHHPMTTPALGRIKTPQDTFRSLTSLHIPVGIGNIQLMACRMRWWQQGNEVAGGRRGCLLEVNRPAIPQLSMIYF